MDMNEPDFEVRNLEDYTEKDLETLYGAVLIAKSDDTGMTGDIKQCLDIWLYRIRDAIAVARKRENETH